MLFQPITHFYLLQSQVHADGGEETGERQSEKEEEDDTG